jgi:hypothetical protein
MEIFVEYNLTVSYESWDYQVTNEIIDNMILSITGDSYSHDIRQSIFHQREHRPRIKITGRHNGT